MGTMLDIDFADLLDYFGDDPNTRSIVLYMESIGDVHQFFSAARAVARAKQVILVKAGRHEAAAKAAASHTGALAGSDAVFDAAIRRAGVLRVDTIPELFDMAEILSSQPPPRGPNLAIITNAGGPGVMATDALITSGGWAVGAHQPGNARRSQRRPAALLEPFQPDRRPGRRRRRRATRRRSTSRPRIPTVSGVLVYAHPPRR